MKKIESNKIFLIFLPWIYQHSENREKIIIFTKWKVKKKPFFFVSKIKQKGRKQTNHAHSTKTT